MENMTISLSMAAAAAVIHIWLFMRCGQRRIEGKILVGHGEDPMMERRMRAHANFTENAPLFLILLALVEYSVGSVWWVWAASALFMLGRVIHPLGMESGTANKLRQIGVITGLIGFLILIGTAIFKLIA